jgi:hypothetical protein
VADFFTRFATDQTVFYRVKAAFTHGAQRIDFDVVSACGVRTTGYADNSSSFDVLFRDPIAFAKRTQDGGAVMLLVPSGCREETTAGGQVPEGLLPGAIWFDRQDLILGVGYLTDESYAYPDSQLKFLGATMEAATHRDWDAFQASAAQDLIDPKVFSLAPPWPAIDEISAHLWDRAKMASWSRPWFHCYGYQRLHLTNPDARREVASFRPPGNPRYWSPGYPKLSTLLVAIKAHSEDLEIDGRPMREYFNFSGASLGFPRRHANGTIQWPTLGFRPSEIFPLRADDGVPWASPSVAEADTIYRDIDRKDHAGQTYCYSVYGGPDVNPVFKAHLPNYFSRHFALRIDGETIATEGRPGVTYADLPQYFFEADEWLYRLIDMSM